MRELGALSFSTLICMFDYVHVPPTEERSVVSHNDMSCTSALSTLSLLCARNDVTPLQGTYKPSY